MFCGVSFPPKLWEYITNRLLSISSVCPASGIMCSSFYNPRVEVSPSSMWWILVVQLLSHVYLWPHKLQHVHTAFRAVSEGYCPSPSPGACSNSCPSSWWCHPTISSSVNPFPSCPQSFPVWGFLSNESALRIRWWKDWDFSFSICPSKEYSGLTSLIGWVADD